MFCPFGIPEVEEVVESPFDSFNALPLRLLAA
jgi:hypothetical protein